MTPSNISVIVVVVVKTMQFHSSHVQAFMTTNTNITCQRLEANRESTPNAKLNEESALRLSHNDEIQLVPDIMNYARARARVCVCVWLMS